MLGAKRPRSSDADPPSPDAKRPCVPTADKLVVYTDGSCLNNGTPDAVAGVGVWFAADDPRNVSEPLLGQRQTNQRAEITAVKRALEQCREHDRPLEIRTDSHYVIKAMTKWIHQWLANDFAKVSNADLFRQLDGLIRARSSAVDFVYVAAHTGEQGNEAADKLARSAAQRK